MARIETMADRILRPNRRRLMAGLGVTALGAVLRPTLDPAFPRLLLPAAWAQPQPGLALHARIDVDASNPAKPDALSWLLNGVAQADAGKSRRGDTIEFTLCNDLTVPMALTWHGLDGVLAAEPLTMRTPLAAGATERVQIPLRQAGTLLSDLRLIGDGQARPSRALPFIVEENEAVPVDRDQICLFEDWRLRPDGTEMAPGGDPQEATPLYTINGQPLLDIPARRNERLRFRLINGFQRTVIAVKIENLDVRVMAMDSQPAEPFLARNGAVVLAPGARVDAFIDATTPPGSVSPILLHDGKQAHPIGRLLITDEPPARAAPLPPAPPLPTNGLPEQLDLRNALRVDLPLGEPRTNWLTPSDFTASSAPAFRAKAGRTVVLALINHADIATVFHLHGHHFRLLDRLDDGWKPFWLDTLAVEPHATQRIAFAAEHVGHWLAEATATDWAAPRLVRWYGVE
ncbi:multicopper oxidase domain-containing protein [Bradyrhizobium sp. dw_78]|uniref:multicopper oxidase domain-containing protein n=1 Tax=Bradyrhizobium sp. dw_78 TaxID=2719793 RepID=UPI00201C9ED7|nr:multicopper oxidase domain-containing protein [Bradyrhizobium sp. dw_78]